MSARPGRIQQAITTDFNNRGDPAILKNPEFVETVEHVWELVRHEVDVNARRPLMGRICVGPGHSRVAGIVAAWETAPRGSASCPRRCCRD